MTQTLNASHTNLRGNKESEPDTGKQPGRQDTRIGHVGLHVTDPAASAEFHKDVFGLEITGGSESDYPLGATAFLSSRSGEQTHDLVFVAKPEIAHVALELDQDRALRQPGFVGLNLAAGPGQKASAETLESRRGYCLNRLIGEVQQDFFLSGLTIG